MSRAHRIRTIALGAMLAAVAFAPRAPALRTGFMIDEKLWLERSSRFIDAVASARFGDAITTGHPGVTTMWIGGLAQRTLPADAPLEDRYGRAHFAMAMAATLLLVAVWLLARPLVGEAAALAGALLLALDPFLLAHTRVLHLDGLQTLTMTASVVALLRAMRDEDARMLTVSGVFAGLAALTKTPSGFLALLTLVVLWRDGRGIRRRFARWALPALGVGIVLWPVLWVRPWKAVALLAHGSAGAIDDSDAAGLFLGRNVTNPGPLFYPVVYALRTSALTLPAGIAAAVWAVRRRRDDAATALRLLVYALGFTLMIAVVSKTADRYLLPAIAALDLVIGIAAARLFRDRGRLLGFALVLGLAVHALPAIAMRPYELAAFNPLAGGGGAARRAFVVGRGEGLTQAAKALARVQGAESLTVATTRLTQFAEFFPGATVRIEDSDLMAPGGPRADLVLFYVSSVQAGRAREVWLRFKDTPPLYALDAGGIPYVRVWRVPR